MGRRWNFQIGEARGEVKDHDKMADKLLAGHATDNIGDLLFNYTMATELTQWRWGC